MSIAVSQVYQPSSARRVALDGFLPVPRGVVPGDLPPLAWPVKDPADVLDYVLDAAPALDCDGTDLVASVAVSVSPSGADGDLRVGGVAASGAAAVIWLSGGVPGTTYAVSVTLGTLKGRAIARSVLLPVQAMAAIAPPATPLAAEGGDLITDQNGVPILIGA